MKFAPGFNPFSLPRPPSNNPFGGYGGMGQQFGGGGGPLAPLGSAITQQLSEKQQPEVQEFMGEVTDMANERFEIDLGAVGQRPMFSQLRPATQMYKDGGAAFPDLSGDGKITQKDILIGRGVIEKQYGGPIGMEAGGPPLGEGRVEASRKAFDAIMLFRRTLEDNGMTLEDFVNKPSRFQSEFLSMLPVDSESFKDIIEYKSTFGSPLKRTPAENMALERKNLSDTLQGLQSDVDSQIERAKALQNRVQAKGEAIQKIKGMQMGGDPMTAPPMPMPAPEQPPMPMQDQLDPNIVQNALAQAAGGIGDLDEAQNYEQVMNTMRGDQATVEERREELAGVVGPGDANQTPESVLTLVQPVMMLANVDQGIGQLAQQEMTQPMEGPMAGGIMSTVPEPPMEAGGTAPVNFNKGGEVRPIQYLEPGGVAGRPNPFANLAGTKLNPFVQQAFKARQPLLSDPADLEKQRDLTKAQILFDLAQTGLAFAAPMEGERPGLSAAERLALAAQKTQLPAKIGARAQALTDKEAAQKAADRAVMLSAITAGEAGLSAKEASDAKIAQLIKQGEIDLAKEREKSALKMSQLGFENKLKLILQTKKISQETAGKLSVETMKAGFGKELEKLKQENRVAIETLKLSEKFKNDKELQIAAQALEQENMKLDNLMKRGNLRLESQLIAERIGINHLNDLEKQEKGHQHAVNMAIRGQAYARELKRIDTMMEQKRLDLAASTDAEKIQIQRELAELEQEKFDYEKLQAGLLDFAIGEKKSFNKFYTQVGARKGLKLAQLYAEGKTTPEEDNTIHFVLDNSTKDTLDAVSGATVPGITPPPAWQEALKARQEKAKNDPSITLPSTYTIAGAEPKTQKKPTEQKTQARIFKPGYTFVAEDLNETTFDDIINRLKGIKGATGLTGAGAQAINTAFEFINFIADKPFPQIQKVIDLANSLNTVTTIVYMDSIKGKTSEELRRKIEGTLPNFGVIRKGPQGVYNKIEATIATLNNALVPLEVELQGPMSLTQKGALQGKIDRLKNVRDSYAVLGQKLQAEIGGGSLGGAQDNRPPLSSFRKGAGES